MDAIIKNTINKIVKRLDNLSHLNKLGFEEYFTNAFPLITTSALICNNKCPNIDKSKYIIDQYDYWYLVNKN